MSFFEELQNISGKGRKLELNMFKNLAMCSFASISAPLKKHPSAYYSQSTLLYSWFVFKTLNIDLKMFDQS